MNNYYEAVRKGEADGCEFCLAETGAFHCENCGIGVCAFEGACGYHVKWEVPAYREGDYWRLCAREPKDENFEPEPVKRDREDAEEDSTETTEVMMLMLMPKRVKNEKE